MLYMFLACPGLLLAENSNLKLLSVPENFKIEIFAEDISSPRQMAEGAEYIFTASGSKGQIYALLDLNNDYVIDTNRIIAKDLFDS